ncbi:MAG: hypothetical protein BJ554DRAFT_8120, partial [Olpidium bornovanus]
PRPPPPPSLFPRAPAPRRATRRPILRLSASACFHSLPLLLSFTCLKKALSLLPLSVLSPTRLFVFSASVCQVRERGGGRRESAGAGEGGGAPLARESARSERESEKRGREEKREKKKKRERERKKKKKKEKKKRERERERERESARIEAAHARPPARPPARPHARTLPRDAPPTQGPLNPQPSRSRRRPLPPSPSSRTSARLSFPVHVRRPSAPSSQVGRLRLRTARREEGEARLLRRFAPRPRVSSSSSSYGGGLPAPPLTAHRTVGALIGRGRARPAACGVLRLRAAMNSSDHRLRHALADESQQRQHQQQTYLHANAAPAYSVMQASAVELVSFCPWNLFCGRADSAAFEDGLPVSFSTAHACSSRQTYPEHSHNEDSCHIPIKRTRRWSVTMNKAIRVSQTAGSQLTPGLFSLLCATGCPPGFAGSSEPGGRVRRSRLRCNRRGARRQRDGFRRRRRRGVGVSDARPSGAGAGWGHAFSRGTASVRERQAVPPDTEEEGSEGAARRAEQACESPEGERCRWTEVYFAHALCPFALCSRSARVEGIAFLLCSQTPGLVVSIFVGLLLPPVGAGCPAFQRIACSTRASAPASHCLNAVCHRFSVLDLVCAAISARVPAQARHAQAAGSRGPIFDRIRDRGAGSSGKAVSWVERRRRVQRVAVFEHRRIHRRVPGGDREWRRAASDRQLRPGYTE